MHLLVSVELRRRAHCTGHGTGPWAPVKDVRGLHGDDVLGVFVGCGEGAGNLAAAPIPARCPALSDLAWIEAAILEVGVDDGAHGC